MGNGLGEFDSSGAAVIVAAGVALCPWCLARDSAVPFS